MTLLALATTLFVIIIFSLLFKLHLLQKKLKYVDEANLWHKLAVTDALTGTYNRNAYNIRLMKMKENISQMLYGIIIFDIDDFKRYNDTKGHLVGDKVLMNTAKILLEVFPEPKYKVYRIGGDEFSVVSENASENEIVKSLLKLKEYLENDGNIRLSKGYSIVRGDVDEAFKHADEMLYADKLSKKSIMQ